MTLTNVALCKEGADEQNMLTAVFGVVDLAANTMTYANAIKTSSGEVRELEVTGPMVGIIQDFDYVEETIRLQPGDEVVMFTDGITEARIGQVMFKKEGVIRNLVEMGNATPDEIAEALFEAAALHAGGDLQDDAAIVVLGCKEQGDERLG